MAAPVVIDGVPFSHLVVFAGALTPLLDGQNEFHDLARYMSSNHLCGHDSWRFSFRAIPIVNGPP